MELLRKRSTARMLCVLMVVCSLFVGARISLSQLREEARQTFYNDGSGYGAASDIADILQVSGDVGSMARSGYLTGSELVEELAARREALARAEAPAEQYAAAQELRLSVFAVCELLEAQNLEELHANWLAGYRVELESAYAKLGRSIDAYNQAAAEFNGTLASFPSSLLGSMTGVKRLERAV